MQRNASSIGAAAPPRPAKPADDAAWDAFLARDPEATLYQTSRWRALLEEVFGQRSLGLVCERDGKVSGALPLFATHLPLLGTKVVSLPYDVSAGGPVARDSSTKRALLAGALDLARARGAKFLQIRTLAELPEARDLGFVESRPLFVTRLSIPAGADLETVRAGVHKHHRRSVQTAAKRGLEVVEASSLEDVRAFYAVYLRVFRDFGTPPYGWSYFRVAWERLHPAGQVVLLLARREGRVVGGMLLFAFGATLVMKFASCAPEAVEDRAYAALYWRAIELAVERDVRSVSWGSSSRAQTGLIEFKERWGGVSESVRFYDRALTGSPPDIEKYYDGDSFVRKVWKRLPLPATALLGARLNRWFC